MSEKRVIPASELIINEDGSIFHLHLLPEQISDIVMLVGDPARVNMIASYFDNIECEVDNLVQLLHRQVGRVNQVSHNVS